MATQIKEKNVKRPNASSVQSAQDNSKKQKNKRVVVKHPSEPIRIIVEVVIRNETTNLPRSKNFSGILPNLTMDDSADCPDNKFKYTFDKSADVTILSLVVGGFKKDLPGDAGDFTTCILDPNDPPSIAVMVFAKTEQGGGRASFSLSLNGKDVLAQPRELDNLGGGILGFSDLLKLPI